MAHSSDARAGLFYGIGAYTLWGLLPLYLHLLTAVPPAQVLANRILWSLLLLLAIVAATRRLRPLVAAARGRVLAMLVASAVLIGINWFVYIWSVTNAHLVEASLGYFINPLLNVALGMLLLGERLNRLQVAAVAVAALGVAIFAAGGGGALWVSLVLALSFGFYGLIRKVAAIDALGGLTMETLILAPFALVVLVQANQSGTAAFGHDRTLDLLLVLAGPVTAAPLLLFAAGARRLRYTTVGLLQFIAPTLQFLLAVLVYHEPVRATQLATFALIWLGCGLYAWSSIRAARALPA
ncbi:MAG: EamA family transporter RarD [Sphingomonas sp.]|jgi:chloramphenicol-sensitive protein RarD|uniref:EamA family transporter RarD n=1 Tax=Sphingomonas sp. CD22 TaxID=3100214 RepID=UPI0011FC6DF7|nr:EamA family transporter RarD [Sphingomonas sp. CD22]MEA1083332.1 EamA family transporter RarD [Sphingomonas sp. CD22]RZL59666.1 MAG: EamA family transporter RarD [Sphingomonas sp.]